MLFTYWKAPMIRNFAFFTPSCLSGPFLVAWEWLRPQTACAAPLAKAGQGLNGNGGSTDGGRGSGYEGLHGWPRLVLEWILNTATIGVLAKNEREGIHTVRDFQGVGP
jgi:hypothetical protein